MTEFIQTEDELDPNAHWLTKDGTVPTYVRMSMRFGLSDPEQFPLIEPALEQLVRDMEPLQNLSKNPLHVRSPVSEALGDELHPISWAIPTGDPVVRFVAADGMQDQMQGTLALGLISCMATLWWGYRPDGAVKERIKIRPKFDDFAYSATISCIFTIASSSVIGWSYAPVILPMSIVASMLWGRVAFALACITTIPIAVVITWLYALIEVAGYGLNMITVSIAAISLGVGIDYVIHVIERFREEMEGVLKPFCFDKSRWRCFWPRTRGFRPLGHGRLLGNHAILHGLLLNLRAILRCDDRPGTGCKHGTGACGIEGDADGEPTTQRY